MLGEPEYTMTDLFAQLGLDSSEQAIEKFITEHQLEKGEDLVSANFWNDTQRSFLQEEWRQDAAWVEVIDELNVRLHPSA